MKTSASTNLIACTVIAGAFAVGFASGPAFAQTKDRVPFAFEFTYAPGDLNSLPKADSLLSRLEQDVRRYCGGNRKMSIDERRYVDACIDKTMQESIAKFGSATLAQAYNSRADG
ncbi:MAG: UrcA family protein [Hyphomonadaceae bacterium]